MEWGDAKLIKWWKSGSGEDLLLGVDTSAKLTPETHMQQRYLHCQINPENCQIATLYDMDTNLRTIQQNHHLR